MKTRIALITIILMFGFANINAQNKSPFRQNDLSLYGGVLGGSYTFSDWKAYLPSIFIAGDYGVTEDLGPGILGLGVSASATHARKKTSIPTIGESGYNYRLLNFSARATYHYPFIKGFDTYIGLNAGYYMISNEYFGVALLSESYEDDITKEAGIGGGFFLGAKYYFQEYVGIYAELGYTDAFYYAALLNVGFYYQFN